MSVELRPDDVYLFGLWVDLDKQLRLLGGSSQLGAQLACEFFTWMRAFLRQAEAEGWTLHHMSGSEGIGFRKRMPTRELAEVTKWFPEDGNIYEFNIRSEDGEGFAFVQRNGDTWTVDMEPGELRGFRY